MASLPFWEPPHAKQKSVRIPYHMPKAFLNLLPTLPLISQNICSISGSNQMCSFTSIGPANRQTARLLVRAKSSCQKYGKLRKSFGAGCQSRSRRQDVSADSLNDFVVQLRKAPCAEVATKYYMKTAGDGKNAQTRDDLDQSARRGESLIKITKKKRYKHTICRSSMRSIKLSISSSRDECSTSISFISGGNTSVDSDIGCHAYAKVGLENEEKRIEEQDIEESPVKAKE